jgi:hypothetical protein
MNGVKIEAYLEIQHTSGADWREVRSLDESWVEILGDAPRRSKNRMLFLLCACGRIFEAFANNVQRGLTKSCGCRRGPVGRLAATRHGWAYTRTYKSWLSMRERCLNEQNHRWVTYGGRGISICEQWSLFENFLADMGERPENTTLDRINNDGNYEPDNCRWATAATQVRNRSMTRSITIEGRSMCVTDWAAECGLKTTTVFYRLNAGWTEAEALGMQPRSSARVYR